MSAFALGASSGPVLVVGAGVLGSRLLLALAEAGVPALRIVDMDLVEERNLLPCPLLRREDLGRPKAEAAARNLARRFPGLTVGWFHGELADLGHGVFRRAARVMACLDGRRARAELSAICSRVGVPLVDGAVGEQAGEARFYPSTACCFSCGLSPLDRQGLDWRQSCSPAARSDADRERHGGAGGDASDGVARLMLEGLAPETVWEEKELAGFALRRIVGREGIQRVRLPRRADCPFCADPPDRPEVLPLSVAFEDEPLALLRERIASLGGGGREGPSVELLHDRVRELRCLTCGTGAATNRPHRKLSEQDLVCPACGHARIPRLFRRLDGDTAGERPASDFGIGPGTWLLLRDGGEPRFLELDGSFAVLFHEDRRPTRGARP